MHTEITNDPPSTAFLASLTLNPVQACFVACRERFAFYVGGVGAGKSYAGAVRALAYALDHPGSLGLIGAPTYPMLRDATLRAVFDLLEEMQSFTTEVTEGTEGRRERERATGVTAKAQRARSAAKADRADKEVHMSPPLPSVSSVNSVVKSLPSPLPYDFHKSEMRLTLPNGAEVLFRSLDEPDRVRGLNLAWYWLDEAPLCGYYAWQILKGRLRQPGYEPSGWATGTPHGRDGYWRDFEQQPRPAHALYRAATHENAAHLPAEYIADLGLSGALYDQEVLGLFTAFAGLVYPFSAAAADGNLWEGEQSSTTEDTEDTEGRSEGEGEAGANRPHGAPAPAGITPGLQAGSGDAALQGRGSKSLSSVPSPSVSVPSVPSVVQSPSPSSFATVIGGLDWGYTNPTAAVIFGLDGDGRAWQLDEWYQRRAPFASAVLPALTDLTQRHGVSAWYCGPDEPEHIAALRTHLRLASLTARVLPADNAVQPGIQTILGLLGRRGDGTRGLYVARRCEHTLAEYGSYQYPPEPQAGYGAQWGRGGLEGMAHGLGAETSEQPLKQNDHALDATRYALHTYLRRARAAEASLRELTARQALRHAG